MYYGVIELPLHIVHTIICLVIVAVIEGCAKVDGGGIFAIAVFSETLFIDDVL